MLIEVIEHVKSAGGSPKTLWGKLYGQEKVLTTSAIARMNLLLHGVEDFKIVREDTLRNPAFYTGNHLAQFDCVVANPPFSLKNWGEKEWASDKWGRNSLGGVPPKGYADWAWVQHMLTSARPKSGRVAVVLPQGALFRQGAEARIRTHILKSDVVDAVIGLAPNLFYGTGLAACVLILRWTSSPSEKGKVLFINGEQLFKRGRNQNTLEPEHAQQLLDAYETVQRHRRTRPRRRPRRDRRQRLQPQHPALRRTRRHRREGDAGRCTRGPGGCSGEGRRDPDGAGSRASQVGTWPGVSA